MITHLHVGCEGGDGLAEGQHYRTPTSITQDGHVRRETAQKVLLDRALETLVSRIQDTSRDRCLLESRPNGSRGAGKEDISDSTDPQA